MTQHADPALPDAVECHTSPAPPHGYTPEKDAYLKRMRRIEGQVRGLQRLIESDSDCVDVLTQVSATTRALESFAIQLVEQHLQTCVREASENGVDPQEKVSEITAAIARLVRS